MVHIEMAFKMEKLNQRGDSVTGQIFWGGVIFLKMFKNQVQGICGQVHWLKKPMLACGKNLPRNNQFSVLAQKKN